jgi:membrane protein DedA with SNARE-associated domain
MLEWIVNTVNSLGYFGIGFLMFLENVFPPIPSELIMPLAGFVVTQGKLDFAHVVGAGIVGSILGALPWYYLGKRLGLRRIQFLADKYGQWLTVSGEDVLKAKQWFDRRGNLATGLGRVVPGIRTYISVPAGINRMSFWTFLLYSTVGTAVWVSLLTYAGYMLGANYDQVKKFLGPISTIVIVAIIIMTCSWIIKRKTRHH